MFDIVKLSDILGEFCKPREKSFALLTGRLTRGIKSRVRFKRNSFSSPLKAAGLSNGVKIDYNRCYTEFFLYN